MSDDESKKSGKKGSGKRKNPWGNNENNERGSSQDWGRGVHQMRGHQGGDLDDMLRNAQDNFRNVMPGDGGNGRYVVLGVIALLFIWLASGLYIVNPGEHAVIQRFGAWHRTQSTEGLGYNFPAPIESRTIVNVNVQRSMTIGFHDRGAGRKQNIPEESLMLTSDRNIVDLDLVILWTIKSSENFLFEIQGQENTIKKVAESAIREVVGQTNMFPIITKDRVAVADRARQIIQDNLDEYQSGVNINQVLIQQAEVHPDVQNAFQDVQSAKQDAEDIQNRAEAYREDILPKARGRAAKMLQEAEAYKQSTVAKAEGDAERFNAIYSAYLSGKDVTRERLYLETMESVLQNARKIIMDDNAGQGVVPYLPLNELKKNGGQ